MTVLNQDFFILCCLCRAFSTINHSDKKHGMHYKAQHDNMHFVWISPKEVH